MLKYGANILQAVGYFNGMISDDDLCPFISSPEAYIHFFMCADLALYCSQLHHSSSLCQPFDIFRCSKTQ
jgi:hypothetical protein